jgi:hypothetical protein
MLVYQARFAHLCSVMSGMHHRRTGYPFGSLVDFANDSMGRELAPYWYRFWKMMLNSVRPPFPTVAVDVFLQTQFFRCHPWQSIRGTYSLTQDARLLSRYEVS